MSDFDTATCPDTLTPAEGYEERESVPVSMAWLNGPPPEWREAVARAIAEHKAREHADFLEALSGLEVL